MSLLDKFKEQFTDRDDEYEDEEYEEDGKTNKKEKYKWEEVS